MDKLSIPRWYGIALLLTAFAIAASGIGFYLSQAIALEDSIRVITVIAVLLFGGMAIYGYSVLQQLQEEKIKQEARESHLLAVMNNAVDAIISIDSEGIVESFNPAAEHIFGYKRGEVIGRNISMLLPDRQTADHDQTIQGYLTTGNEKIVGVGWELEGRRKDGRLFPIELGISEVVTTRQQRGFVAIARDISERKEAEQQLQEYATQMVGKTLELAIAKEQAERANQLKSEFLANMSHEIRTPMNGIIGMTHLLLDCDLKPLERGYAETVQHSVETLLQIINDILDFSKIEAGKIELEAIPFDLQLLCEEVCEMMAFKGAEKGIELLLRYPPDVPCRMIGDPGRARQILSNLLSNAIKFTESGHVLLTVQCASAVGGELTIHIEVEDTGIGIPADRTEHIFNKFSQADGSTSRRFGGTGLGLSICRELVYMMGGDIGVRSTEGAGSTFWFEVIMEEEETGYQVFSVPQAAMIKGMRILLVDDNETARHIICEQLQPYEVSITTAVHAKQALSLLKTDNRFNAIVTDFMMPDMNGAEFGRRLKQDPATRDIPLMMITSAPNRGDRREMEELGFAAYLSKPLAHWHLRDALAVIADYKKHGTEIPMLTQHNLKEAKTGQQRKSIEGLRFQNVHVLLVEDNAVNLLVAMAMLEKSGCKAVSAGDGEEAVKLIKHRTFDLVLMDCQMPIMDGFESTRIIRQLEKQCKRSRVPIIAFTAHAMKGDQDRCLEAGMDDYLAKPIRQGELEEMLLKWLPAEKRVQQVGTTTQTIVEMNRIEPEEAVDKETWETMQTLFGNELESVVSSYLSSSEKLMEAMLTAYRDKNAKQLRDAAHPLKSSSQLMGGATFAQAVAMLESRASASDVENLDHLVADSQSHYRALCSELRRRVSG